MNIKAIAEIFNATTFLPISSLRIFGTNKLNSSMKTNTKKCCKPPNAETKEAYPRDMAIRAQIVPKTYRPSLTNATINVLRPIIGTVSTNSLRDLEKVSKNKTPPKEPIIIQKNIDQ